MIFVADLIALRCPSRQGNSSLGCFYAFSACWVAHEVLTILIFDQMYVAFGCVLVSQPGEGVWIGSAIYLLGYYGQLFLHYWQRT
jgi:hypothetical protein